MSQVANWKYHHPVWTGPLHSPTVATVAVAVDKMDLPQLPQYPQPPWDMVDACMRKDDKDDKDRQNMKKKLRIQLIWEIFTSFKTPENIDVCLVKLVKQGKTIHAEVAIFFI